MGCATTSIKYLVFLFNTLCAILGIAIIVVNAIALKDIASEGQPILIIFIVVGSIMFLISFFGCCGAFKENICMTWTVSSLSLAITRHILMKSFHRQYAISVLALLIISIVLLCVYRMHIDENSIARHTLNHAWENQKNGTDAMSAYQKELHCCGINGPMDYTKANLSLPKSCYSTNSTVYDIGCLSKLEAFYKDVLKGSRIVGWILMVIEIAAFVCATILGVTFRNEQRRSIY
ncbi:hypothetical protein KR009_010598 [Drosophila setifemur]|nr:hypothetical protein KR009_010598 [Drosophila setifemur]